jgi:beta-mannanase
MTPANAAAAYYPGDQFVDWVAMSGFNAGPNKFGPSGPSFDELFGAQTAYLRTLGKPIAIGETACVQASPTKPGWIADAYNGLSPKYPEIKAIVYYNARETSLKFGLQDWRINSSAQSQKAYSDAVAAPSFVGGPMPALTAWQQSLSPGQRKAIASYPKLY